MAEGEITTFTALTEKFNLPPGNYKKPKLLYCSNGGHFLRILPDGTVDGTRDRSDQHIQLQLSAESVGEVYIKSTETGQYLAMDTDGLLYGSPILQRTSLKIPLSHKRQFLEVKSRIQGRHPMRNVCSWKGWRKTITTPTHPRSMQKRIGSLVSRRTEAANAVLGLTTARKQSCFSPCQSPPIKEICAGC
ncbi:fibroblast growth factor 1 isoform X1 [Tursiops truncatus]|uniref:fibroblast growth factor 1 isoform X1 n=1 Tax=Tursiops truncatus TaxID=9739 RepID=UPI000953268D